MISIINEVLGTVAEKVGKFGGKWLGRLGEMGQDVKVLKRINPGVSDYGDLSQKSKNVVDRITAAHNAAHPGQGLPIGDAIKQAGTEISPKLKWKLRGLAGGAGVTGGTLAYTGHKVGKGLFGDDTKLKELANKENERLVNREKELMDKLPKEKQAEVAYRALTGDMSAKKEGSSTWPYVVGAGVVGAGAAHMYHRNKNNRTIR